MSASVTKPAFWVPGDWNGFFGLFTNVLLNVIVLTGLCLGVVQIPAGVVFGRILPALGIALPLGNMFYAYLAYQLAKKTGRSDVTAMPYGPSVPHMFLVVFVIMLPTYLKTHDPILAWDAGLAWAFIIGVIVTAGISIAFISLRPAVLFFLAPWLGFFSFGIILISWMSRVRLPFGVPGGLAAVVIGTIAAWIGEFAGLEHIVDPAQVGAAFSAFGIHLPLPSANFITGLANIAPLLVTAIPLGIYNFTEGMNNVESASAAGDSYDLRKILLADGIGAMVGSVLGSPFPPAVYIGHPGWKAVGGRIGYSLATGVVIALVCFLGITALLLAVVPLVAILPILLYIGLVIGAQAFEATPPRHAPAVILALLPNIANWCQSQIDGALGAAGTSAAAVGFDKLAGNGVIYQGMQLFGGGATLAGLILGAIAAFIIDREFEKAAIYAAIGAVLAFFGFINGTQLAFGNSAPVALGYAVLAATCLVFGRASLKLAAQPVMTGREEAAE